MLKSELKKLKRQTLNKSRTKCPSVFFLEFKWLNNVLGFAKKQNAFLHDIKNI